MTSRLIFYLLIGIANKTFSQESKTYLAKVELNDRYGCIGLEGKEIIPVKYDDMGFWGSNLIPVNIGAKEVDYLKEGGKWGYCNSKGIVTIPLQFDKAETFHEGIAAVKIKKKWGFIDITGKIIIQPQYDQVRIFRDGLCAVARNKKWGFIDTEGKEIIKPEYGELFEFENGVAKAFVGQKADDENFEATGSYCLINKKGERIIEPKYVSISNFSDGLARVEIVFTEDRYALVDKEGKFILGFDWHELMPIDDDLLIASRAKYSGTGVINLKGEAVIPFDYTNLRYADMLWDFESTDN